jgi:hypothetical protein
LALLFLAGFHKVPNDGLAPVSHPRQSLISFDVPPALLLIPALLHWQSSARVLLNSIMCQQCDITHL